MHAFLPKFALFVRDLQNQLTKSGTIILTYNKSWEEGVEPLKTFKINVAVE